MLIPPLEHMSNVDINVWGLMETYVLNVGEDKRRGVSSYAHNHSLVSGVAEHIAKSVGEG